MTHNPCYSVVFVEYPKDSRKSWFGKIWRLPAIRVPKFGHSDQEDWLGPKIYKGSMHREEDE